ncbi:hypothetical protein N7462_008059 [Penicillium macrosclerotiorum]|uniref:uncharacterized protein n=1 Tax=Penicillium macrosclerotiorum TaxID=303699 RepID=UPI0025466962|nr:uncharacterized protein N7462_008059 [Penicillium macrosclerotiorum]KAJ5679815.1 hypothetical protein N7462_008059 [Penicillium macrosclerotiorum]
MMRVSISRGPQGHHWVPPIAAHHDHSPSDPVDQKHQEHPPPLSGMIQWQAPIGDARDSTERNETDPCEVVRVEEESISTGGPCKLQKEVGRPYLKTP